MKKDIEYLRKKSEEIDDLYYRGKEEECVALLKKITREAKDINEAYYQFFLGEEEGYLSKDFDLQFEYFNSAARILKRDFFLIRNIGNSLLFLNREEEAIEQYNLALEINKNDSKSLRSKGIALSRLGEEERAVIQYNLALEINPKDYDSLRQKGVVLSKLGKDKEAIAQYNLALEINPKDYDSLRQKGVSFNNTGRYSEAIEQYDIALSIYPNEATILREKAVSLDNLGQDDEAMQIFKKIQSTNPFAKASVAENEFKENKLENAVKLITEAFDAKPNDSYIKSTYSYIMKYAETKNPDPELPKPEEKTEKPDVREIEALVKIIREKMQPKTDKFFNKMALTKSIRNEFLSIESLLDPNRSLFLVLRKWNSYTPIIPDTEGERYVGGGYFILHEGKGTVIDPGYNFIENFFHAGGRVTDIHNIILTHAHNDHTIDFESILSLIYQYNSTNKLNPNSNGYKRVNIYMNIGCFKKFSGLLDLRGSEYIGNICTLNSGSSFNLSDDFKITALTAYHDELITKKYSIGVKFYFKEFNKTILLTSDTGLFPHTKKNGETVADHKGKEIWETYDLNDDEQINLLITHIGSIKEDELKAEIDTKPEKVYYPNHLGIIGTSRVITSLKPKLAIVSEFGEELKDFQEDLIDIISKIVKNIIPEEKTKVIPGDTSFIYDINEEKFYCILKKDFHPSHEIAFSLQDDIQKFYYYGMTCGAREIAKVGVRGTEFESSLKLHKEIYFK